MTIENLMSHQPSREVIRALAGAALLAMPIGVGFAMFHHREKLISHWIKAGEQLNAERAEAAILDPNLIQT